jgi:hypothetical protein
VNPLYDTYGNKLQEHLLNMTKLIILLLLFPIFVLGQKLTTTELSGQRNIYNDALKHYLILTAEKNKSVFDTLYIQQDDVITDSLMTPINGTTVVIVDSVLKRLRQSGSFTMHRIFPLSFDKGVFFISLVPFVVTQTDGEIMLTNTGTFRVEYYFDDRTKAFRFKSGKSYEY